MNFGGSTDREALDARVFAQVGLAGVWAFPLEFADDKWRSATVFLGTYYGVHPYPRLDTDDVVYSTTPRPHFNDLGSLGIKVDFTLPLTERMEVVLGGRYASALGSDVPENWQVFVGLSVPIGRVVRDLLGAETK